MPNDPKKKNTEQKPMPSNPKSDKSTSKDKPTGDNDRMGGMIGEGRADDGRGGMKGEQ